jgi:hypothetical protein
MISSQSEDLALWATISIGFKHVIGCGDLVLPRPLAIRNVNPSETSCAVIDVEHGCLWGRGDASLCCGDERAA